VFVVVKARDCLGTDIFEADKLAKVNYRIITCDRRWIDPKQEVERLERWAD